MRKTEFADLFMKNAHLRTKQEANRQVETFIETLKEALVKDNILIFRGLGSFEKRQTKRKEGRNPKTGEFINFTPKIYIKFKAGMDLKARLNKK